MSLKFTNRRFVPPQDLDDDDACQKPWLNPEQFMEPHLKKQLFHICNGWLGSNLTDDRVFSANYDDFQGGSEVPIEFWDVVDEDGAILYQLWLFDCGCGTLFENGTDNVVSIIAAYLFDSDRDYLYEDLCNAWKEAKKSNIDCVLTKSGNPFVK